MASVRVDLGRSNGNVSLGAANEEEVADPSVDVRSKGTKGSKVNAFSKAWHLADMT